MGIVVGVSRDRPRLHAFVSAGHPERPLVLRVDHWDALARARGPIARVDWLCGDHGTSEEEELVLDVDATGIHVTRRFYGCTSDLKRGGLIRSQQQ